MSLWWIFSLCASFSSAIYSCVNQIFKMDGKLITVYRGLLVSFIMLPFVLMKPPITNPTFYILCIIQGFVVGYNNNKMFRATKAFGAATTSTIQPLSIGLMFFLWIIITPSEFFFLASHPVKFVAIILCLLAATFSVIQMKKAKTTKVAFKYIVPILLSAPIMDILNKKSMQAGSENLSSAVVYYICITAFICGLSNLVLFFKGRQKINSLYKKNNLKKGFIVAIVAIAITAFRNLSMYYTANPAYVSAIILLAPIWIIIGNNLYMKITKKKTGYKKVNVYLASLLLMSIIGLILLNKK